MSIISAWIEAMHSMRHLGAPLDWNRSRVWSYATARAGVVDAIASIPASRNRVRPICFSRADPLANRCRPRRRSRVRKQGLNLPIRATPPAIAI